MSSKFSEAEREAILKEAHAQLAEPWPPIGLRDFAHVVRPEPEPVPEPEPPTERERERLVTKSIDDATEQVLAAITTNTSQQIAEQIAEYREFTEQVLIGIISEIRARQLDDIQSLRSEFDTKIATLQSRIDKLLAETALLRSEIERFGSAEFDAGSNGRAFTAIKH